ncbi:MAG: hypothetical protein KGJ79_16245 [Alphaproteobacteria bacterium]|nr:hypothetical protein [Alphaproteobacteria bacterium]MDE2112693.1 hypothetical protein [Alphaproteobacteria bacterium]MDE2494724.1 hypothetical protein [Alphaproteobacteria bacterium]
MANLSTRNQILIGLVLATLMAVTRGQHMLALAHMPGASAAVFFIAGLYLRSRFAFPLLLVEAVAIDYAAIQFTAVSNFCISPAYVALLPAYGALWLAGRWYAKRMQFRVDTLVPLVASVAVGGIACELISSGSFYVFSGRFPNPTLAGFASRLAQYLPQSLEALALYVGLAAVTHVILTLAHRTPQTRAQLGESL